MRLIAQPVNIRNNLVNLVQVQGFSASSQPRWSDHHIESATPGQDRVQQQTKNMHKFASWRIQKIGLHLIDISPILAQKFQVFLPVCKSNFHQPAHSFPLKNGLSAKQIKVKNPPQSRS